MCFFSETTLYLPLHRLDKDDDELLADVVVPKVAAVVDEDEEEPVVPPTQKQLDGPYGR